MEAYRTYNPGYDNHGKLNDLSDYFKEAVSTSSREFPTLQVWPDGRPKGLGTVFRTVPDSRHFVQTDMCRYDFHDSHNNKLPANAGMFQSSSQNNAFCLDCHQPIQ